MTLVIGYGPLPWYNVGKASDRAKEFVDDDDDDDDDDDNNSSRKRNEKRK